MKRSLTFAERASLSLTLACCRSTCSRYFCLCSGGREGPDTGEGNRGSRRRRAVSADSQGPVALPAGLRPQFPLLRRSPPPIRAPPWYQLSGTSEWLRGHSYSKPRAQGPDSSGPRLPPRETYRTRRAAPRSWGRALEGRTAVRPRRLCGAGRGAIRGRGRPQDRSPGAREFVDEARPGRKRSGAFLGKRKDGGLWPGLCPGGRERRAGTLASPTPRSLRCRCSWKWIRCSARSTAPAPSSRPHGLRRRPAACGGSASTAPGLGLRAQPGAAPGRRQRGAPC